ncbi:MAG: hypothetical protein OES24_03845 [Acidimicrobiia bacterium]|nr:hypothetical protein [Acidimicrobiia bacterium]
MATSGNPLLEMTDAMTTLYAGDEECRTRRFATQPFRASNRH